MHGVVEEIVGFISVSGLMAIGVVYKPAARVFQFWWTELIS